MDEKELTENEKKKEYLKSYGKALRREQRILDEIQCLRLDKMFPFRCPGRDAARQQSGGFIRIRSDLPDEMIEDLKKRTPGKGQDTQKDRAEHPEPGGRG